jgi:hypothetical protein
MNNTTTTTTRTKRNLALAAVFVAVTLVVGTLATTTNTIATTGQSAYPYSKKDNGKGNDNGNTVTIEECKNRGSASGFDTALDQECENLICTHPGENATCVQEGAAVAAVQQGIQTTPVKSPCEQCFTKFLNDDQILDLTRGTGDLALLCEQLSGAPALEFGALLQGELGLSPSAAAQLIQCLIAAGVQFSTDTEPS